MFIKVILRLRIGIDRPTSINEVPDYVLTNFTGAEEPHIDEAVAQGILKLAQHIGGRVGVTPVQVFGSQTEHKSKSEQEKHGKGLDERG